MIGVELRPFRFISLYADVGLPTAPYVGVGATLYLWGTDGARASRRSSDQVSRDTQISGRRRKPA